jgi:pilus assembly protein CpaC
MSALKFIHGPVAVFLLSGLVLLAGMVTQGHAQEVPNWSATSQPENPSLVPAPATGDSSSRSGAAAGATGATGGVTVKLQATLNKRQTYNLSEPVKRIEVDNEAIADVRVNQSNARQVYIVPNGIGTTNISFMNEVGDLIIQLEVRVNRDISELNAALKQFMPNENIMVSVYGDSIFLTGNVQSAPAVDKAISIAQRFVGEEETVESMLNITGSQQVIIMVRVAEMDRSISKNLAVGLEGSYGDSRSIGFETSIPADFVNFVTGTGTRVFNGLGNVTFEALEQDSLIKTLAEPTLTALSGETATFISGGEVLVPTGVTEDGIVYSFREFGIQLSFTPVVIDKGRIRLEIATEISEIDNTLDTTIEGLVVKGFKTKTTETTVDMSSGSSMMISGLLENNNNNSISGIPFLKDIPVLGTLFRSTEFQRDETELVITVTVYLAKPVGNDTPLALPTDGFEPASDIDLFLLGRLHREYGVGERPFWSDMIKGPFGYIMK